MKKKVNNEFWQDERFIWNRLMSDEDYAAYWDTCLKEYPDKQEFFEGTCHYFEKIKIIYNQILIEINN